jgi:hypothetical protein
VPDPLVAIVTPCKPYLELADEREDPRGCKTAEKSPKSEGSEGGESLLSYVRIAVDCPLDFLWWGHAAFPTGEAEPVRDVRGVDPNAGRSGGSLRNASKAAGRNEGRDGDKTRRLPLVPYSCSTSSGERFK